MRNLFYILLAFCIQSYLVIGNAQTTYTVTNTSVGNAGVSLNDLDDALSQAIIDANNGAQVTILFDAPGLVRLTNSLPIITITAGSITLEKAINTSIEQGLICKGVNNSVTAGIIVSENTGGSMINFKNLSFKYFFDLRANYPYQFFASPLQIKHSHNVTIENCIFEKNDKAIYATRNVNFKIKNNIFKDFVQYGI